MTTATARWDVNEDGLPPTEAETELRCALDAILARLWAYESREVYMPSVYIRLEHEELRERVMEAVWRLVDERAPVPVPAKDR